MTRVVPERSWAAQLLVVFGGFLVGPLSAIRMSAVLAPGSEIVQTVAPLAFVLVFAGGVLVWTGLGMTLVVVRGAWSRLRGRRPGPAVAQGDDRVVPGGYVAFPVLGAMAGLGVGVLSALLTDLPKGTTVGAWITLGLAYGGALWAAAHHGYLPFSEPE